MASFERRLRKVEQRFDGVSDFYDCASCLWPGARVDKGHTDKAKQEFDTHNY